MPYISEHAFILSTLQKMIAFAFVNDDSEEEIEELVDTAISSSHFLNVCIARPQTSDFMLNCAMNLGEQEFRQTFCVSHSAPNEYSQIDLGNIFTK